MSIAGNFSQPVTPLHYLVWSGSLGGKKGHPLLPSLRVLFRRLGETLYETPEETINGFMARFHGTAEEFLFCQQRYCPEFYQMPQWARVAVAARAASGVWDAYHMPEMIRTVLGEGALGAEMLQQEWPSENYAQKVTRTTLVHCVAQKIGGSQAGIQRCHNPVRKRFHGGKRFEASWIEHDDCNEQGELYTSWNCLFREFLLAKIDVHQIVDRRTPLIAFLQGYFYHEWGRTKNERSACVTGLGSWLTELEAAGIDLDGFGQKEVNIWKSENIRRDFRSVSEKGVRWKRLINIVYGANPSDWNIWFSESSDSHAGEFWDLLEKETEVMPGSWPVE
jgi:hypothetical protein